MRGSIYTAKHRKLVAILRDLRVDAGITQVELARKLKRPQSFVSAYEAGQRRLDLVDVDAIARATGSTLGAVVARYEQETRRSA